MGNEDKGEMSAVTHRGAAAQAGSWGLAVLFDLMETANPSNALAPIILRTKYS